MWLFLFWACACTNFLAQQTPGAGQGEISGRIVDSLSMKPIEYATVGLMTELGDKTINGITSDDQGAFKLNGVPEGTYKLSFYFIGYRTGIRHNITIDKAHKKVTLGNITLSNAQNVLKEVEVVVEKSLIENKIDKMVYNADKDLTSQGGVATDILKKIPQVSVDVNGNIDLQGNTNIRFLINGKPSSMFGNNIADVLQSIPASQIQSIEVVTSPGAKYDAEGGGIINIILRKSTSQGFNGNVSLTGGSRLENSSVNLSARKGKFGLSTFFSGNAQLLSTTLNNMSRISRDSLMQQTSLLQNGSSNFSRNGYQAGINFDWALTAKDNVTASFNYNDFRNSTSGLTTRNISLQDVQGNVFNTDHTLINADNRFNAQATDWSLSYKHEFKKEGQELDFLYSSSIGTNFTYYKQTQRSVATNQFSAGSYGNNPGSDQQTNISLNYTHPVSKALTIETGVKTVLSYVSSSSDVYLLNPLSDDYNYNTGQSNNLHYTRNIGAGYISGTMKLFDYLDVKAGCRYEYTETKADFSAVGPVNVKPYNTLVPSGAISHTFKGNQTLKLNYSRRISRPSYRDLNPFLNASDPKNISTGDPSLSPETSQNIELGYNKYFEKGANLNVVLFFRGNYHDIQPYSTYYSSFKIGDSTYSNVVVSKRANIGTEDNIGLNLFASVPITPHFSVRSNVSLYQRYIMSIYSDGNIQGFMYRINLTASYQISKTISAEVFGNFNSPRINVQGTQPTFTTYNFAIRKFIFNKKGSIAFTTTNPFNKYVPQKTVLNASTFTSTNTLQLPYRSFGINFTYKFGKMEFKKQKEVEDVNLTNPTAPGN